VNDVFRCDYCGTYASTRVATILWVPDAVVVIDGTDNTLCTTGLYCSPFCARQSGPRVGGR
jgi:hypothetical protein